MKQSQKRMGIWWVLLLAWLWSGSSAMAQEHNEAVCRFLSGKRESIHLLSTLYIKQLPLPSTILPIRGTLGLFQGVVLESDFCHTNFRTTVAYDKFTNNF